MRSPRLAIAAAATLTTIACAAAAPDAAAPVLADPDAGASSAVPAPPPAASSAAPKTAPSASASAEAPPQRRRDPASECVGASFDLRAVFTTPGPCRVRGTYGDLSAADAAALRWHLAPRAAKPTANGGAGVVAARAGQGIDFRLSLENTADHPIAVVIDRPCNGIRPLGITLPPPSNVFGLGEPLARDDREIDCRGGHAPGEGVELVLLPGGRATYDGTLRALLAPEVQRRDDRGFPIGPEPKPRRLNPGTYTLLVGSGMFVPMNLAALPGPRPNVAEPPRMAWYPRIEEALKVR